MVEEAKPAAARSGISGGLIALGGLGLMATIGSALGQAGTSPALEVATQVPPARREECRQAMDNTLRSGLIARYAPGRVYVDEAMWKVLPFDSKAALLAGVSCADLGTSVPRPGEAVSARSLQTHDRLGMLDSDGRLILD